MKGNASGAVWNGSIEKSKKLGAQSGKIHLGEATVVVKADLTAMHKVSESDAGVTVKLLLLGVVLEPDPMKVFRLLAFSKLLV
jgi:hypothetical protein